MDLIPSSKECLLISQTLILSNMPYIYQDKQTDKLRIFGSVTAISKATGIKPDNLYTAFSRNKLTEFENDSYRIIKTKIERS